LVGYTANVGSFVLGSLHAGACVECTTVILNDDFWSGECCKSMLWKNWREQN